ncbi:hypothetical protein AXF42_Ash013160 [Apostasia shenzhenica]|uniref:Uncharacterized protein n=1 Tax=Apostasia shenzhenica TaxID=1088818 RepID=A0A2I0BD84_9ASPA|nr:hypothetical protein AXF42_Ash013160 [Apostasia shenzhenica]
MRRLRRPSSSAADLVGRLALHCRSPPPVLCVHPFSSEGRGRKSRVRPYRGPASALNRLRRLSSYADLDLPPSPSAASAASITVGIMRPSLFLRRERKKEPRAALPRAGFRPKQIAPTFLLLRRSRPSSITVGRLHHRRPPPSQSVLCVHPFFSEGSERKSRVRPYRGPASALNRLRRFSSSYTDLDLPPSPSAASITVGRLHHRRPPPPISFSSEGRGKTGRVWPHRGPASALRGLRSPPSVLHQLE